MNFLPITNFVQNEKFQRFLIFLFFIIIFILGFNIYSDYGVHYDETVERYRGLVNIKYLSNLFNFTSISNLPLLTAGVPNLETYKDGDHGPLFDIIAVAFELILGITVINEIYNFRHFLNFIFFWFGLIAFFLLIKQRFINNYYSLLGALLLLLSPRIFADAFYNSKDIVFLSLFTISLLAAIRYILNPNWKTAIFLGFFSGLATDVRLLGVFVPLGVIFIIFLPVNFRHLNLPRIIISLIIFISSYIISTYLFWPWLWHDPINQIFNAFNNLSKFPVQPPKLYLGKSLQHGNIPWHYIPVWILITTPILYLIFGFYGLYNLFSKIYLKFFLLRSFTFSKSEIIDLFILGFFIVPIFIVIALKSTLYDGWRHMFFIYPPFIYFTIKGFSIFYKSIRISNKIKLSLLFFCISNLIYTANWIRLSHPFQNAYFNLFAGINRTSNFDGDYWGLGIKSALLYLLNNESDDFIYLYVDGLINMELNLNVLNPYQRKRIVLVDSFEKSKYVITNFRNSQLNYKILNGISLTTFHNIIVDNEPIISIYRVLKAN
jgi:hypothetical protein